MKKNQIRKSVAALAMAVVVGVSLLGYGCGSKSASTAGGVSGDFTGTAKGMGGDVTVTLTLEDGKITGCTAEGKDETPGIGTLALEQLPAQIAETDSIAVDGVSTATITSNAIKEAAAAALTAAGLNADDYKIEVKADETKAEDSTVDADVVIVGAGGAGMTAAITAAAEGKSVVIVESQAMVGGNSVRATGGMNAGKTVYQDENEFGESAGVEKTLKTAAEKYADNATITALAKTVSEQWAAYQADPKGYFDSVELMELDTMIGGKGINDPALVETLCSNSADAIDWLDEHGITLHSVSSFGGASVKRIHRPVDAEGKTLSVGSYMIPLLQENCDKAGVQTLLNTTATELLTDANGAVVGVKATGSTGETITALAKTVSEQWAEYQKNPTGYFDSVELMELDTMIGGKGINDPALVETLCSNSADAIDWLDEHGITLHSVSSFGGASVKRIHRPVDAEGKTVSVGSYMIPLLEENCEKAGVQILLNTTANEILTDASGAAVGIKATGSTGETVTVNAKAVVLTTGGFGANLDMVVEYKPELKGFMTTNAAGAQGQGIEMATAIGAGTVDMDQIQIHPTVEANTAALITEGLRGDGAVLINAEGKRFIDEVGTRDVVSAAEIAQTGSYSWLVVDQAMVDASSVIQGYIKKGYTVTGETYEELGKAMSVDEAAFAETMKTWNGYVEAKNDPDFGRTSFANPLDTAPYYAIKVTAGVHHTMGGLTINTNTEVLKEDGTVIPGLFAAGEVTGGVHGANRLGGNAVADFTVFGRIAGKAASDYAA